LRDFLIASKDN
jgi:hypothetical protein